MRANVYDTGILVRGNLLLPDLPAVIIAAGLRHEDLDYPVSTPMVDDNFSSGAHVDWDCCTRIGGLFGSHVLGCGCRCGELLVPSLIYDFRPLIGLFHDCGKE